MITIVCYYLIFVTFLVNEESQKIKNSNTYEEVEVIELNGKKYIKDVNGNYVLIKEPTQQDIEQNGVKTTILAKVFKDEKYIESENGNYITIEKGEKIK